MRYKQRIAKEIFSELEELRNKEFKHTFIVDMKKFEEIKKKYCGEL